MATTQHPTPRSTSPGRGPLLAIGLVALVTGVLTGCRQATPIPDGAEIVHVVVSDSEVILNPDTVPAGDVYIVLDAPMNGSLSFVERHRAGEEPGPLTDDDLERLARGDTEGTAISGLDAGGCDAGQRAADRGKSGPCGNVMMVVVAEGQYAILGGAAGGEPTDVPPMGVLTVAP